MKERAQAVKQPIKVEKQYVHEEKTLKKRLAQEEDGAFGALDTGLVFGKRV